MIINKKLYRNFILNRIFANTDLISPNDGYKIDSIIVTMGGTDITSSVVTDE